MMNKRAIVKARSRQGAKSLDLTIPVKICRDHLISDGDAFSVEVENTSGNLKIIYSRVFKQQN
jgi:hypothetical protein